MASKYAFAIIDKSSGEIVAKVEPIDTDDIVEFFADRLSKKGVGFGRTTNHVLTDARNALKEIIFELKTKVKPG